MNQPHEIAENSESLKSSKSMAERIPKITNERTHEAGQSLQQFFAKRIPKFVSFGKDEAQKNQETLQQSWSYKIQCFVVVET